MRNLLHTLKTHPGVKRYGQNMGWLFLEKAFRMLVTLFVGIWMVRYLGPAQFGILSYAQSIAIILITVSGLGLDTVLIKELVQNKAQQETLLGTAIVLKLIAALAIIACLSFILLFNMQESHTEWLILIITMSTLFSGFQVISNYFQAHVLSKFNVIASMLAFSLVSLVKVTLILVKAPVIAFAVSNLIEYALVAAFLVLFYQKTTGKTLLSWRFEWSTSKRFVAFTWPLTIATTFAVLLDNINQIMIKWLMNTDAVGHYVAAARLSEVWFFVGAAVLSTFFPAILNAQAQDDAKYKRRIQRLLDLLVMLAIVVAVPVSTFSQEIVLLVYGQAYADSGAVLAIHIWAGVFVFLKAASGQWLVMHDFQQYSYYRNFIAIVINVLLNIILIPVYGIAGAAASLLITLVFSSYLLLGLNRNTMPCFIMQTKALCLEFLFRKQF